MESCRSTASAIQPYVYYFSIIHILLSLTAFLSNSSILVALHKESSLHPPSRVLYRCLAITDLLVGLVVHPLAVIHFMSFIHEDWGRYRWTYHAVFVSGYALCSVSLSTMTAISVDRLLALLLGLRYRQIVTVKRIHVILGAFWIAAGVVALCRSLIYHITFWYGFVLQRLAWWSHPHLTQRFLELFVFITFKYKIMLKNIRANQMHWTSHVTERPCTMLCACR